MTQLPGNYSVTRVEMPYYKLGGEILERSTYIFRQGNFGLARLAPNYAVAKIPQ